MNHSVYISLTLVTAIVERKVISKAIPGAVCQKINEMLEKIVSSVNEN